MHVVCPHCGAINRLPADRLREAPSCGKCRQALFSGKPLGVDTAGFERHLKRSELPLLVDFWAPWCGPCKMMAPAFERAAAELAPEFLLLKVNTDVEQGLAARYQIRSIPTLMLFAGGREVARQPGAMSSGDIVRWARAAI